MLKFIPLDSVLTEGWSAITEAFTFITSNSLLGILITVLIAGSVLGVVFSLFRR